MLTNQRLLAAENQCKGVRFEIYRAANRQTNMYSTMFEVFKVLITNYFLKT